MPPFRGARGDSFLVRGCGGKGFFWRYSNVTVTLSINFLSFPLPEPTLSQGVRCRLLLRKIGRLNPLTGGRKGLAFKPGGDQFADDGSRQAHLSFAPATAIAWHAQAYALA